MSRIRLAIVATHPIQYYAPLFQLLTKRARLECHIFYGWTGGVFGAVQDPGFGRSIEWDIPLLEGYSFTFVSNESADPGTHHWGGIRSSQLLPLLREWRPDALLTYGWKYRSHFAAMRASHGEIPVLLRGDSTLLDERPSPRLLLRRAVLRYVYRHVDIGLYVGQNNREYFLRNGLKDSQLRWAPHSIDNDRFADVGGGADRRACVWRRQLGIDDQHTTVLFAGKLEPTKAPDLLLRVFLRLAGDNEHLIIVGTGALEGTLRAIAAGHARVHFLGFQNQSVMPDVYRLGDVFVLPSQGETWGLAINEAMAAGRPVIVSDKVGCAPDLVRPENGVVFQSGNEEALGTGLMRVLRNEVARFDMGMASKKRIAAWSFEAQASAIEEATAYAISAL